MVVLRRLGWPIFLLACYGVFYGGACVVMTFPASKDALASSVVIPAEIQPLMYFGDRYLAANIEATRVLGTGGPAEGIHQDYFDRLHQTVAKLNGCHEDNFYVANALLPWAGSVDAAIQVMSAAMKCRYWDELPPFFLGYTQFFFKRDPVKGSALLNEAAKRATKNQSGFAAMAIAMQASTQPDTRTAVRFLKAEFQAAKDEKLKSMLSRRVQRLEGLVRLQDAQMEFERKMGRRLLTPTDLIARGFLPEFPVDPTGIGYEFDTEKGFGLKEFKVGGLPEKR